ncbi:MAG: GNAT family N-acetyltransferase [candidate division KSB1 bacterium]|jgi:ribosomal protein S18 acetylase RimI-like enzyme|nr:GNAT family N-acetyltransferase [candidate division KSB1 bacterium]
MNKNDKAAVMTLIRETDVFTQPEVTVAEELIDRYLDSPNQKDYLIVVIEENNTVAGYLCYGPTDLTEGTYDLYWMAVHPDFQGRGLGKKLVEWLVNAIENENGRLIIIETSSQHKYEATRLFYARSGCEEVARIPDFYKVGDDRVIYIKKIK